MHIAVVGSGYVGLVAATCLSEMGNDVICVDNNSKKIEDLNNGITPIYEPGLETMIKRNKKENRLSFTTDIGKGVRNSSIVFIAVGTPPDEDGSADLKHVLAVAKDIAEHMDGPRIVVNKSTVPVGTADLVRETIENATDHEVNIVSNPEFLKEGSAIDDFMKPDRVVVGTDSQDVAETMRELYSPFVRTNNPVLVMSNRSAEMTKYVANSLLATRISFMNEIANMCDLVGADVHDIRVGIGSDRRIGPSFLFPGAGFGGSCFPKDIRALQKTALENGMELRILKSVTDVNRDQKRLLVSKVTDHFGEDLSGINIGLWGISFKPNTDDIREAPALKVIEGLLEKGASISAYDPQAMENAAGVLGNSIRFASSVYDAVKNADALVLVTEWTEFREPDLPRVLDTMNDPVVFDGRNVFNPLKLRKMGFTYYGIGRNV
ncbi:MAG: nucleotide sugar dehydrogenase [Candidatus Aegiribacteria sp.]|nr:nucleotide sugar dehydrogenase [Candidatus Aegiribacteria sp.]MBD3295038.1 nucleotide sugar dehydrogenase [Candidatus Fermentibacteria bacterium]